MVVSGDFLIFYLKMGDITRGSTFLIPFIIILIFGVLPLAALDTATGQYYRRPLVDIYVKYSWKYVGNVFVTLINGMILAAFYVFLMAYCNIYIYMSIFGKIDWIDLPVEDILIGARNYFRDDIMEMNQSKVF